MAVDHQNDLTTILADPDPTYQQVVDAVYELQAAIASERILPMMLDSATRPVVDPGIRGLATRIAAAARANGAFSPDEVDRLEGTLTDVIERGDHEHAMWARIRNPELNREWHQKVRRGDVPPKWVWPLFADAPGLEQVRYSSYIDIVVEHTSEEFLSGIAELAQRVASGPSASYDDGTRWVYECREQAYVLAEALRGPGQAGLNAGQLYRAQQAVAALFNLERLLDPVGRAVDVQAIINQEVAHQNWHSGRAVRIVPGPAAAQAEVTVNRWEWRSSLETLEQLLIRQTTAHMSPPTRDEFWNEVGQQVDHLERNLEVLSEPEQARALALLDIMRVGAPLESAWPLITSRELFELQDFQGHISDPPSPSLMARSRLIAALAELEHSAAEHRSAYPGQPLPYAVTIHARRIMASASYSYAVHHTESARIDAVVAELLKGGESRYLVQRVLHSHLAQLWWQSSVDRADGSDWVLAAARPGHFPDLPALRPIELPEGDWPLLTREGLRTELEDLYRHVRTRPQPTPTAQRSELYRQWEDELYERSYRIINTAR
ncbi:hypothetical protein, partial [Nocardia asiatica]|uniref:hypothetical protein n=1 Tax=Nocardia asiatica TaxID=209252 RepID=UPI0005C1B064